MNECKWKEHTNIFISVTNREIKINVCNGTCTETEADFRRLETALIITIISSSSYIIRK